MMVTGTPGWMRARHGCAPGMLLIGVGGGMLFMPLVLTATASVAPKDAGVTSGVISTSQQLGGALGLAILAILATSQTHHLQASRAPLDALNSGFHLAFLIGGPGERRCAGPRSARTIPGVGSVVLSSAACWRCCWSTGDKSCPLSVCSTSCGAKRRPRRRETSRQRLVSRMRHARVEPAGPEALPRAAAVVRDRADGAEAILELRAIHSNGDFEEYWRYHLAQEHQRNHRSRYANNLIPTHG